jgi:hypothetical protein
MSHKGQAELIVIVALMVVIAVVVISQMNLFIAPELSPDAKGVQLSVEGFVRTAVLNTIETMSEQGGYLLFSDYQLGSAVLNDREVPYWQRGGQVTYPDKASNLQAGVQAYLEENRDGLAGALGNVTLGSPSVGTPAFRDDSITVTVSMPTTYKGIALPQPYTVTVNTKFSEIYDFARGFIAYEAGSRPFEYFTLGTMALSPLENGHHSIPIEEVLIGCGDYLFAGSWDVMPEVERAIFRTLAHTYMPGKVPEGTLQTSSSPKWPLVPINGRGYEELDVAFMLPDDFGLDHSNFRMSPDPATGVAEPIPMMGECMGSEPIWVEYTIEYPAIVTVPDPDTGNTFQFAFQVFIVDNAPADWSTAAPAEDLQAGVCSDMGCVLELNVQDSSGSPVEAAAVGFMGCSLGRTDSTGYLATLAPCGSGTLHVYARDYGEYLDARTSAQLDGTVTLYRRPTINLMVQEVRVQDYGSGSYMIFTDGVTSVEDKRAFITFRSAQDFTEYSFYPEGSSMTVSSMPAGNYYVSASLLSPDFSTAHGAFAYPYTIREDTQSLYLYIPTIIPALGEIEDELQRNLKVGELSRFLEMCGAGPVSETPYSSEEACSEVVTLE